MNALKIFSILTCVCFSTGQWIDPHSMDSNLKRNLPNLFRSLPERDTNILLTNCDEFLKRIIRLLLTNAYLEDNVDYYEGYINLKLTTVDHKFLTDFSKNKNIHETDFGEVSVILENSLQKPFSSYYKFALTFQESLYKFIFNPASAALAFAGLVVYTLYKMTRTEFTWKMILKYFLAICYVVDVVIIYLQILHDREINSMVAIKSRGMAPPECNPEKMSWWTYVKTRVESTFFENPCKVYYQTVQDDYKYLVAPSVIFSTQFKSLIEPMGTIGEAFGRFGRGMFTSLPWGLNVFLFPLMLIASLAIVFMLFLFVTKPQFKLRLFHLFTVEMGQHVHDRNPLLALNTPRNRELENGENERRRRNASRGREVGLESDHRALVEDVSNSSHNTRQKQSGENRLVGSSECEHSKTSPEHESASVNSNSSTESFEEIS